MVQNEDGFVYKVRSCIGGQIGWLLGHRAPRLCYSSLPPIAESTATRLEIIQRYSVPKQVVSVLIQVVSVLIQVVSVLNTWFNP